MAVSLYSALFFIAAPIVLYAFTLKQSHPQPAYARTWLWAILGVGFCLRLAWAPWAHGFPYDIDLFRSWAMTAAQHFSRFYQQSSSNYPPLYMYVLFAIGKMAQSSAASPYFFTLLKLPSIFADVATSYLIYRVAIKHLPQDVCLLAAAFYVFNPAVFINSTMWGQVDSFFTLVVAGGIVLLSEKRLQWAVVLFALAVLMKPQGIITLPVLFFELVRRRRARAVFSAMLVAAATVFVVVLPFALGHGPLWIFKLYASTIGQYPYASVNGFNLFALLGANYVQDTTRLVIFSYRTWGFLFIGMVTLCSWYLYAKSRDTRMAAVAALLQIAGVFTFSVSMHERYLFAAPALALLAFAYLKETRLAWLAVGLSLTSFLNMQAIYFGGGGHAARDATMVISATLNIVMVIFLIMTWWSMDRRHPALPSGPPSTAPMPQ